MDHEASALLERILLDEGEEPTSFPIGLLKSITNDFSNDQKIGSGGFADVYKGQLQGGIVAVKKLKQQSEMVDTKFVQEAKSMMKVKHKNVVRFLGYCSDTQGKMWKHEDEDIMAEVQQRFLCFEFLEQGSLDKHISDASSGLEWRTRYHIIKGICEGLHYLHGKKIVHSDLKPENILLDHNMVPKIGDFGLARSFHEGQTSTMTQHVFGTLGYMAPESFGGKITLKADIYSLGSIITEMLIGKKKDNLSIENVHENWTTRFKTSRERTWLEHVTVCAEIGLECMNFDPNMRPTTGHIIDRLAELEHKFGFIETAPPTTLVLDVNPRYIWFPLESDKVIKYPVTLTNKTDDLIGAWITPTSLDPGYPYVWEQEYYQASSVFRRMGPHSSHTIFMTMRKQEQPRLEAAEKGTFDVVMVAAKSKKDLERLETHWRSGIPSHNKFEDLLRGAKEFGAVVHLQNKFEDLLRGAKEFGAVVHLATLRAAVTSEPARCQEVTVQSVLRTHDIRFCMDVHPTETWLVMGHWKHVSLWNYETQLERVTKFIVQDWESFIPSLVSSVKFVAGEQWLAVGDGGGYVHVYAYSSFGVEKDKVIKRFKAHSNEVHGLAVYPKHTMLLTGSLYDQSIKLWDWSQGWTCARVIDTHGSIEGRPLGDAWTFAITVGGLVKVWDIHSLDAIATFEGLAHSFGTDGHRDLFATDSFDEYAISSAKGYEKG